MWKFLSMSVHVGIVAKVFDMKLIHSSSSIWCGRDFESYARYLDIFVKN